MNDYDLEDELSKSIAHIIDEETTGAEVYVKNSSKKLNKSEDIDEDFDDEDEYDEDDEDVSDDEEYDEEEDEDSPKKHKKLGLIIGIIAVSALVIVLCAFLFVKFAVNKSHDNFAYSNNKGIEYLNNKEYDEAADYLEKALKYEEADKDTSVRYALYECYVNLKENEKAAEQLEDILEINGTDKNALVYLLTYYDKEDNYDKIAELYEKFKSSSISDSLAAYAPTDPKVSKEGGDYAENVKVTVSAGSADNIYYTTDGSDPTKDSTAYSKGIELSQGETTLKIVSINKYGIKSNILTEEYNITYTAPDAATISPKSGTYTTAQKIVFGNIPTGGNAYYTTDGSTPTKSSTVYNGPFDMPEGTFVLKVLVVDGNGLSSDIVSRAYVLNVEDKYTDEDAIGMIWNAMISKKIVDKDHKDTNGSKASLEYFSKKDIYGMSIWVYTVSFTDKDDKKEAADYKFGVDSDTGFVYKITGSDSNYKLTRIEY